MALATILWAMGPLTLLPVKTVRAATSTVVQYQGCGDDPCWWIPPQGQVVPVSSGVLPLFSFQLKKTAAATLTSIKVNITAPTIADAIANNEIGSLRVYKQTDWSSWGMYAFPDNERIDDSSLLNGTGDVDAFDGSTPNISSNTIYINTTDDHADETKKNAISDSFETAEYIVGITTSANWAGTDQIGYALPVDWITVSDGTLGSVFTGQSLDDLYYATAPTGWSGDEFNVEMVDYMGTTAGDNHEIDVGFSSDVNETSAETRINYTIGGTNPLADPAPMLISPMTVRLTFASSVTITSNQTEIVINKDIQDMMGNVLDDTTNVTMMIMGGGGDGGLAPVMISEVMIGTESSGLEEFIELHNPTSSAIDFSTMPIRIWTATESSGSITHTKIKSLSTGSIPANGYYLIAAEEYTGISPAEDTAYDASAVEADEGAIQANAGVYISASDTQNMGVIDKLGWGTAPGELTDGPPKCSSSDPESCTVANNGKSLERKANHSSTAATMMSTVAGTDGKYGNGYISCNNQFDFIQRTTAEPQSSLSDAEVAGGAGYGDDNSPPYIMHNPLSAAVATQDLIAIAEFMDDSGLLSSSNVKLYYRFYDNDGTGSGTDPESTWNPTSGSQTSSDSSFYRFTIPAATLDADKDLDYFLRAYDGTHYTCLPSPCDASTDLLSSSVTPFYINVAALGGSGVISGTVEDTSGNAIPDVLVFTEGMPFTVTTNTSGAFTISGLPDGMYMIRARGGSYTVSGTTANYTDGWVDGIYINDNNQTSTSNTITLVQTVVEDYRGTVADQENPWVMWSAPNDNMMGFPKEDNLTVVFDRAMQSSTITGGSATTDNVYLMDTDGTIVTGVVTYYPDSTGRPDGSPPDPYMMIYNPTADLSPGSYYTLVVKDTIIGQNGKRLMGNRPSGGHSAGFTVASDYSEGGDNYTDYSFGSGGSFPPYIIGTTPGSGSFDVSLNTKINVTFNESMSSSSINETNIVMYTVSNPFTSQETETAFTGYTVSQNTTGDIATLTPNNNLGSSTHYRVKVLSNCTSANGTPMSTVDNGEMFRIDFNAGTSTDTTAPTIAGTYPDNNGTDILSNISTVDIGFSEAMDASTINSGTIKLKQGSTVVAATVEYNVGDRTVYIMPTNALRPGSTYTIFVVSGTSGVKDIAGNALASDYEATFTTDSTADSTEPFIEFARCDDYSCSITFSEPMISARADDTNNYSASVLNKDNYEVFRTDSSGNNQTSNLATNIRPEYEQMHNTVRIEPIAGLAQSDPFKVVVSNVKDKASNTIGTPSSFRGTAESSMGTGGMMGPGGPGPMMGPGAMMDASGYEYGQTGFDTGGMDMTAGMGGSMGFDFGGNWEKPTNAMPMNMMAGKTTSYFIEFGVDTALPAGGTIKLTFPSGTDVSQAAPMATTKSMPNKDLNGPGSGTVTIAGTDTTGAANNDGVAVNTSARSVTVTINASGDGIGANDFVMFDLKGIKNPSVPKSFDSNGYTVDIKTFNTSGVLLDSFVSFPYFINEAGDYTLTGTITATDATTGTATVYLDSWMTGPMEDDVTFSSGTGIYTFTGLSESDYHLHTEPTISLGATDYTGYMKPEPIYVSSSNTNDCSGTTCTKNFSFTKQDTDSAYQVTINIVGDFTGMSGTDLDIDIFAGGPSGHSVKTVEVSAQEYTVGSPYETQLYLTSTGEWWVGMGPAMPHGTMMMGPPPMPSWMSPGDQRLEISSGTAYGNIGTVTFTVTNASNEIIGYVIDGSGNAIANVDVDAHRTQGGFGMPSHGTTDSNGKFTLKVTTGTYEINAWMPGLPWSPGRVVEVKDDTSNVETDGNSTADVYKDNGTTLVEDLTSGYDSSSPEAELLIELNKSSTTISGQLLDDSNNPVAYAPVWAYDQSTGMHMPSGTDSAGNFTIYAGVGDWYVEAFIPGIGDVSYANNPVSITSGSSQSDIIIRPASDVSFSTISGTVTISGSTVSNANIWVDRGSYHNGTNTNSSGEYRLRVPANAGYTLKAWMPDYGELDPVTVDASSDVTQNFTVEASAMHTLTINFTNSSNLESDTEAFIDIFDTSVYKGNNKRIDDLSNTSSTTMMIKDGSNYEFHLHIPGLGGIEATCSDNTNIDCTEGSSGAPDIWAVTGDASVTFALPSAADLYTFTVTVTSNASSTPTVEDAFVWIGGSSFHTGKPTNSSGVAVIKVPAGTYELGSDKPGYTGPAPVTIVASNDSDYCTNNACTKALTLSSNPYTLSGTVTDPDGNAVSRAWVWADKVTSTTNFSFTGGWTGTETNTDGTYELSISDGYWLVRTVSDAYAETTYTVSGTPTAIQISSASQTGANITMSARSGYTAIAPKSAPMTPASGGTIDDTGSGGTGVKLVIPASVLGTGTSAGTVNIQDTYSVPSTSNIIPLGGKGKTITATNSSGQAVTSLSGSATIEISYDADDLPTADLEGQLMLVYFDASSNQWIEVASSQDTTNDVLSGDTTHFSIYAIALAADDDAPTTPGTPSASSTSASSTTFSWTASTDTGYGLAGYEVMRSTDGTNFSTISGSGVGPDDGATWDATKLVSSTSYTDTGLEHSTTYYYQIIAWDNATPNHNHSASSSSLTVTTSTPTGGGGTPTASVSTTGQGNVTQTLGGEVSETFASGKTAKVDFDAGTIEGTIVVKVESQDKTEITGSNPLPENIQMVGDLVADFTATSGGTTLESFDKEVTITFTYEDSQITGLDESTLSIYYWNESTNQWVALTSTVNTTDNIVEAQTAHFTYFALLGGLISGEEEEASIEELRATIETLKTQAIELITQLIVILQAQVLELQTQLLQL